MIVRANTAVGDWGQKREWIALSGLPVFLRWRRTCESVTFLVLHTRKQEFRRNHAVNITHKFMKLISKYLN